MNNRREEVLELILNVINDFAATQNMGELPKLDESTQLFGTNGLFDSLGLVAIIMDVEQEVENTLEVSITIADERAMSQKRSPFRTIGTFTDYVTSLVEEEG